MTDETSSPLPENFEAELAAQPHDAWFKQQFSDLGHARALFVSRLPADLAAQVRWEQMQLVPASFVKNSLRQLHSDLLFTVPQGGGSLFLYLLCEHQTRVDPLMPLRLLEYMAAIWARHLESGALPLPPIVPLVLHQGPERWLASPEFADLFGADAAQADVLRPFLPRFRHLLLDLTQMQPETEEMEPSLQIVLQLMKLAREKDRLLDFFTWLDRNAALAISDELFRACLLYSLHVDQEIDFGAICGSFLNKKQLRDQTMSIAQKLKREGREEGECIGSIRLLQQLMNEPVTSREELQKLDIASLLQLFQELEAEYNRRNKR